ncbi:MAG: hypothetical protein RSF81_02560 [Oscillospiraceae bacterium]
MALRGTCSASSNSPLTTTIKTVGLNTKPTMPSVTYEKPTYYQKRTKKSNSVT